MKAFILTEGGKNIGFGHVVRCASLYHAFEERGINPDFFINGDDSIDILLKRIKYKIFDWINHKNLLLADINNADVVIVDSYLAGIQLYTEISNVVEMVIYVDDNKRLDYPQGLVVNANIYAKELSYPKKENIVYLLGSQYALLRKEFWDVAEKKIDKEISSLMITFGGDDGRNMTPKILELMCTHFPEFKKNVIIGQGFKDKDIDEIGAIKKKNINFVYSPNTFKMKQVILDSDVAISAGGQTLYELARVGLPTIAVAVAQNQLHNVDEWARQGFIEYAGWYEDSALYQNIVKGVEKFMDVKARRISSAIGRNLVPGNGAKLVVESILQKIKIKA